MLKIGMAMMLFCCMVSSGFAVELLPERAGMCFPVPERTTEIFIAAVGAADGTVCEYRVGDYAGRTVGQGREKVTGGRLKLALSLPQGYYELYFPEQKKAIGLVVLPPLTAAKDGFWCLDAGLSWSKWQPETKREMIAVLTDRGMSGFRDRLGWPQIDTGRGGLTCDGSGPALIRDTVYTGGASGRMLDLFQDSPVYLRRDAKNPFAVDLVKSMKSWSAIGARFGRSWSALELWNEPFYVHGLPADQYVPVAKAVAASLPAIPVAAGCFSPSIPLVYLDNCADNGLLDVIDVMTLHLYGKPESTPELMLFYLNWLKRHGREQMPLWVSESGTPGQLGALGRPDAGNDAAAALSTVMRAIECKAYGVRRFYAFYLQRHIEGVISWGMTDAAATPQRGLAAWLYAARAVGDAELIGDLSIKPDGVVSAHAFASGDRAVLVLYAPGKKEVKTNLPCRSIAGIDGRVLIRNQDGSLPVPDGVVYLDFSRRELEPLLDRQCAAMKANAVAGRNPSPRQIRKLIVQPEYNRWQTAQASNLGYFVKPEELGHFKVAAWVANLASLPQSVNVTVKAAGISAAPVVVELPPGASKRVEWTLDLRSVLAAAGNVQLQLQASGTDCADRAVLLLQRQPPGRIYQAVKCGTAPKLDGDPGDAVWRQAKLIDQLPCLDDSPQGEQANRSGLDAKARVLWDNTALYFLIEVDDREHEPAELPALSWQKDCVQIAIHQENSPQDLNSFEFGFFLDTAGRSQVTRFRGSSGLPLSGTTQAVVRRDDRTGKTVYEGRITWLDLGSMQAINDRLGLRFRMSFIVNDFNHGHRRWLEWSPGIAKDKNPFAYPEIILSEESGETPSGNLSFKLDDSWKVTPSGVAANTVYQGTAALKIQDRPGTLLGRSVETTPGRPLTLSFLLAASEFFKHKQTGFNFKARLFNDQTREGIELWIAPGPIFAQRTGFALADVDGTIIKLGEKDVAFKPDGKMYRLTLVFDPESRIAKIYLGQGVDKILLAEGQSKRVVRGINRLEFSTSGWGAGPLVLADLFLK